MTEAKSPSEAAAEELKRVRTRKGWNQQQLADRMDEIGAGIDRATISKIEKGYRRITLDEVFWFAYALGVSPAALMFPRPGRSILAVTPKTSVRTAQALHWLRGTHPVDDPDDAGWRFFEEETIDQEALTYRRRPTLMLIRAMVARAVAVGGDKDTTFLRELLTGIREDVEYELHRLDREEKTSKPNGRRGKGR
jgi:transcriptional regulator with XRE-family HTH domain